MLAKRFLSRDELVTITFGDFSLKETWDAIYSSTELRDVLLLGSKINFREEVGGFLFEREVSIGYFGMIDLFDPWITPIIARSLFR